MRKAEIADRKAEGLRTIGYNARVLDGINGMNEIGAGGKGGADFPNQGFPANARRREGINAVEPGSRVESGGRVFKSPGQPGRVSASGGY